MVDFQEIGNTIARGISQELTTASVECYSLKQNGVKSDVRFRWHITEERYSGKTHFVLIGMNPSDATSFDDPDPTVSRVLQVIGDEARFSNFGTPGRISIVNLTPVHGSDPRDAKEKLHAFEPSSQVHEICAANETVIKAILGLGKPKNTVVIPMWGTAGWPFGLKRSMKAFLKRADIRDCYHDLVAIPTSTGQPAHPNPRFWFNSYWNSDAHDAAPKSLLGETTWPSK